MDLNNFDFRRKFYSKFCQEHGVESFSRPELLKLSDATFKILFKNACEPEIQAILDKPLGPTQLSANAAPRAPLDYLIEFAMERKKSKDSDRAIAGLLSKINGIRPEIKVKERETPDIFAKKGNLLVAIDTKKMTLWVRPPDNGSPVSNDLEVKQVELFCLLLKSSNGVETASFYNDSSFSAKSIKTYCSELRKLISGIHPGLGIQILPFGKKAGDSNTRYFLGKRDCVYEIS